MNKTYPRCLQKVFGMEYLFALNRQDFFLFIFLHQNIVIIACSSKFTFQFLAGGYNKFGDGIVFKAILRHLGFLKLKVSHKIVSY